MNYEKLKDIKEVKEYIETLEIMLKDGDIVLNSKQIAELTNKEHKRVLEDIDNEIERLTIIDKTLLSDIITEEPIFKLSKYTDSQNKERRLYILNRDGIYQILARYSPFVRRVVVMRIRFLEEVAKLGGRQLEFEDISNLHNIIKPILYYIYDIYSNLALGENSNSDLYQHLIEERDRWLSIFKDEEKFEEWVNGLKQHYQDTDVFVKILGR